MKYIDTSVRIQISHILLLPIKIGQHLQNLCFVALWASLALRFMSIPVF